MEWIDDGVLLSARRHGEASMLVSLLTRAHGRQVALSRMGVKGTTRGVLQPGNQIRVKWRGRLSEHLGTLSCELVEATAARHLDDTRCLACLTAACSVTQTALPEGEPYPRVFDGLTALLSALKPNVNWGSAYVKWEMGVLGDLGFGLDLSKCAVTGEVSNLRYVSPRTGRAVSEAAAGPYRDRLLPLPPFLLVQGGTGSTQDVVEALTLTGHFLERHVYAPAYHNVPKPRLRLMNIFTD